MTEGAPRAGILITGTEVLTGIISDRNGPWLSDRLRDLGVDTAMIQIVGDRPDDLLAALRHMAAEGLALVVTSGGLGPTADDLTAEVVGRFCGAEMVLDPELEQRIADILRPLMARWPGVDPEAVRVANRKQAMIPRGAEVLEPVGTAPGLVVPPAGSAGPTIVVLPGPPRELQAMWPAALATSALKAAVGDVPSLRRKIIRLFGLPESEIAQTLRAAEAEDLDLRALEITTCLRRGEIEIATRFVPEAKPQYDRLQEFITHRHGDTLFSRDGSTIDEQVAALLSGHTIAVAESCTGGLMAARLTERAGSSAYFAGGLVVYSNQAKIELAAVEPAVLERHGAVSVEVARALAEGASRRFEAQVGVGITGIAGPGGGTEQKPVGTVCFSVCRRRDAQAGPGSEDHITRRIQLPGSRGDVRDRSTTVALHLLRRLLAPAPDHQPDPAAGDW